MDKTPQGKKPTAGASGQAKDAGAKKDVVAKAKAEQAKHGRIDESGADIDGRGRGDEQK